MEAKAFNKWSVDGIKINDPGLVNYINLEPRIVPRSSGKFVGTRFNKTKVFIVERLINKINTSGHKAKKHFRSSGHMTGKAANAYSIVEKAFTIIEAKTKKNPVDVFVQSVVNGAPREEIISIEYGGARYPKAVEVSPLRRVDIVIRYMTQGAYTKSFNTKKDISQALADEIMAAANSSPNSAVISKKNELERQADASR